MNKYITKITLNEEKNYRIDKVNNIVMKVKNSSYIDIIPNEPVGYTVYDPVNMTYTILSVDDGRPLMTINREEADITFRPHLVGGIDVAF